MVGTLLFIYVQLSNVPLYTLYIWHIQMYSIGGIGTFKLKIYKVKLNN